MGSVLSDTGHEYRTMKSLPEISKKKKGWVANEWYVVSYTILTLCAYASVPNIGTATWNMLKNIEGFVPWTLKFPPN